MSSTNGLVSPLFIGRRDERTQLVEMLQGSVDGTSAVALIGGEAGVGKSRLVAELVAEAAALDMRVLFGNCVQLGAEGLPFAPLVDALRVLSRSMDREELDRVLGPARGSLRRLLPNLDPEQLPGNEGHEVQGPQLLELVLGLIERLVRHQPRTHRHRGPALGRPVHPGAAGLSGTDAARPAGCRDRHLPVR